MSRLHYFLKLTLFLLLCSIQIKAQITAVGNGSYTTTFPGVDQAGRNGFPAGTPQITGSASERPIPTNDWWSKLLLENHASNLFNYPMTLKTTNGGLVLSYIPWGVIDDQEPIIVGIDGLDAPQATVSDYSDWTVTMDWNEQFNATAGIGMPFVYFDKEDDELARVTINLGTVVVADEMITVTDARNGADFVVYAPEGSTWVQDGATYTSTLNGNNYWTIAMLPLTTSNVSEAADSYQDYAYVFPENTTATWDYDVEEGTLRTDFTVTTDIKEGDATDMLLGLLPHQWGNLADDSPDPAVGSYTTVRGELKMLAGNSFSVENSFHGILPTLPYLANYSDGFSLSDLNEKVEMLEDEGLNTWTDSYNEGQVMNRLIQTARIAHEMGNNEARDKMIATIKERLEDWLTAEAEEVAFLFYYNEDWTAMLGYPAGHGQDSNINDHHFHWGYFIHAAAFMEQFEPGWAEEWGDMVNLLVRDAASHNRTDNLFPFLRNFSPYAGHCWANGFASFPQGNDQESTSESMQFNSSLIHWGSITGNDEIRDLGIYLYTTEQSAVEEYWFDVNDRVFSESQQYSLVSRVWGNSYDNGTFWTNDIAASYGIELYPMHGGSLYLGHNLDYAEMLWSEIESNTEILGNSTNVNLWHDTMWKYLALIDAEKAIDLYDAFPDRIMKFGVSDAQTYYWIHAMSVLGTVDASITADHPLAVAFDKEGETIYVAHNYSMEEIVVTFSDGLTLTVPAHDMATSIDVSISGSLTTSFPTALPGGSTDLFLETGDELSRVEFYNDQVLLGTVEEEPYEFTATDLTAGVHNMHAKMYIGESFDVTNLVTVTVGRQLPYSGVPIALPGSVDAGAYDTFEGGKGQGVAYLDLSPGNNGDFRTDEDVDVATSDSQGSSIGWISAGEWVEYSVSIENAGRYSMSYQYASDNLSGGGPFHLELNDQVISADINIGYTGGWTNWQSGSVGDLLLPEGEHILKVAFCSGEFNLGRMTFSFEEALESHPPVASAGENVVVILPSNSAQLDGSASADDDEDALTYHWEQINGASVVSFDDHELVNPTVSNLVEGIYLIQLTVSDGEFNSTDEVLIIVSETGNSAPSVSITSPSEGASYQEGDHILIEASASDLEGEVVMVEFYNGEEKIGEDSTAPFSFNWTDASIGEHELSAVATDDGGLSSNPASVSVTVSAVERCSQQASGAQQGAFSIGYISTFETVGTNVTISFELLDNNKVGVVAFLWQQTPFAESGMDHVTGNEFSKTISGLTAGETITYACKFAFAGGLAVTDYITYEVGTSCGVVVETELTLSDANWSLHENSPAGTSVGDIQATYNGENSLSYSILSGNDLGAFEMSASGALTVLDEEPLDFETNSSFTLQVNVSDGELSDQALLIIQLMDVDESVDELPDDINDLDDDDSDDEPNAPGDEVLSAKVIESDIAVFPNPTTGILNIQWNELERFQIIDISGAVVLEGTQKLVDVSYLKAGLYFLNLMGENQQMTRLKILKQ